MDSKARTTYNQRQRCSYINFSTPQFLLLAARSEFRENLRLRTYNGKKLTAHIKVRV